MMKKMLLEGGSAAFIFPAVVTPSTPSAAPSAAKGVFARAVTVDEQSERSHLAPRRRDSEMRGGSPPYNTTAGRCSMI